MQRIPKTPPFFERKNNFVPVPSKQTEQRQIGTRIAVEFYFPESGRLLDLVLEVLASDEVGDLVIIGLLLALLHVLVALGELAERGKRVGAKLVQDAGDELGELLVLAVAVDGKGVGGDRGVDYRPDLSAILPSAPSTGCTHPWGRRSG